VIYVDEVQQARERWNGSAGRGFSHLISDESVEDLRSFALSIGLPTHWMQPGSYPHFDLSPNWRRRAIAAGARPVDRVAFVAAMRRGRDAMTAREDPPA
jgi:hypothetical protein